MAAREHKEHREITESNKNDWMSVRRLLVLILCTCVVLGIWNFIVGKWFYLSLTTAIVTLLVMALQSNRRERQNKLPNIE
jgi:uncharacterized ion transporter superfamily protein YfcC